MSNDITIKMRLEDSGSINQKTTESEALRKKLEQVEKQASRALKAGRAPAGKTAEGAELEGYNKVRGSVGTGAAGRDFANQAQGLGGVVRLYATFAANIFAVTAAFTALQQAANYDRLIKGSEMMSERTGVNLKRLGKDLEAAAGHAVSFEEAMQFANMGTSAGIAAKQMVSLVEIAKGAAAGLGRDVNDSVKRIIQGTAKQEQEILDELGIFVKAKDAYEVYAKKFDIKGGGDALSAQQKVAAYADAVEKAGAKWKDFAKLEDPFGKFTASGKEALNTLLNLINQALIPFINWISESKGALMGVITLISTMLVKRALPELKDILIGIFSYDKNKASAKAAEARLNIAKDMAHISNTIAEHTEKLEQQKLKTQQVTNATILSALDPKMVARTNAAGNAMGAGLSAKKVVSSILGTEAAPADLSKYKSAADIEEKFEKAVKKTIGTNEEKLKQMVSMGVLQKTSTLEELKLSKTIKDSAAQIYSAIDARNKGLATELQLQQAITTETNKQAALQLQLNNTIPGKVQALQSYFINKDNIDLARSISSKSKVPEDASNTVKTAAASGSTVRGMSDANKLGADIASRMEQVAGAGMLTNIKSAGTVLMDLSKAFMLVEGGAAKAAIGWRIFGFAVSTAIKGILAALGPLMLVWTAWELISDTIFKKENAVRSAQEALNDSLNNGTSALSRLNSAQISLNMSQTEYASNTQIVINTLQEEINATEELIKKKKELKNTEESKEAKKKDQYLTDFERNIREKLKLDSGQLSPEMRNKYKQLADAYREQQKIIMDTTTDENSSGGAIGIIDTSVINRQNDAAEKQNDLILKKLALDKEQIKLSQQLAAEQGRSLSISSALDDAIDDIAKKRKNIPRFEGVATTPEANAARKQFSELFKDSSIIDKTAHINKVREQLEKLAKEEVPHAQEAFNYFKAVFSELSPEKGVEFFKEGTEGASLLLALLKSIATVTDKYTASAKQGFIDLEKSISDLNIALIKLNTSASISTALGNSLKESRGFSDDAERISAYSNAISRAEMTRSKALKEAQLQKDQVINVNETNEKTDTGRKAVEAYNNKQKELDATYDQQVIEAKIALILNKKEAAVSIITKEYEKINAILDLQNLKTQNNLKLQEEKIKVLKEAQALPEVEVAKLESNAQQTNIQMSYAEQLEAAKNIREEERKKREEEWHQNLNIIELEKDSVERQKKLNSLVNWWSKVHGDINFKYDTSAEKAEEVKRSSSEIAILANKQKVIYAELNDKLKEIQHTESIRSIQLEKQLGLLNIDKERIQTLKEYGLISDTDAEKRLNALDKEIRLLEHKNKLQSVERTYSDTIDKINADASAAREASTEFDDYGNKVLPKAQSDTFRDRVNKATETRTKALDKEVSIFTQSEKMKEFWDSLDPETKGLANIYKDTFGQMGNTLMDFVTTGKNGFEDLAKSAIASIAKMYMNNMFNSLFGAILPTLPGTGAFANAPVAKAKGAVYIEGGVEKFAKGGYFTNSIVNTPTLFKFAKGTGLMGEAGPEAIMPLKRDSNGNLGVRANTGGNVEVVVNNYSTAKAETKETTDSRGNRKVEVVIGDITAGEVGRSGSRTNRAIQGTFGLQPQLIRR